MLDSDLAKLYRVETKQLKRAVKRNLSRFPEDFMFELNKSEYDSLRCQIGALKQGRHAKYLPFVFTEQGVAMLSSVLNSERAIAVNVQIMRMFVKMRQLILNNKDILRKLEEIEMRLSKHDDQIIQIYNYIKKLLEPVITERKQIGFKTPQQS